MKKYIFFDLDGTLTDPALGITNSIMYLLEKTGRPIPPRQELYKFIGPPLVPAFKSFLGMTEEEGQEALTLYREYYADRGIFENEPYEGIYETLAELQNSGHILAVATSKPELYAKMIFDHFDMTKYFATVSGASMDEKLVGKADIIKIAMERLGCTPDECIMVGDREHDIIGGREAGMEAVGVLWGFGGQEELTRAGAKYIVSTTKELADLLK